MPKSLPSSLDLIKDSWHLFISTWNESMKVSVWFLYFGLVTFLLSLLQKFLPNVDVYLGLPLRLALFVVAFWAAVRLIRAMLLLEAGKKFEPSQEESMYAWRIFWSTFWVGLLQILIIVGSTFLFVIPGIYFSLALTFSQFFVIDQGLRGMKALGASRDLVRGRWWATMWRLFVTGLVFSVPVVIGTGIAFAALVAIASPIQALADIPDPLFQGTYALFNAIIQAATLPLFIGLQVKVYRALLATKG